MATRGHILVVDNAADNVDALEQLIEEWGYQAFTAHSAEQAKCVLHNQHIDLALIDVRLVDDNEPSDRSGIRLAEQLDDTLVKILMTGGDHFELRSKWLRRSDVYLKDHPISELKNTIAALFERYVHYNHNLKITWPKRLTAKALRIPLTRKERAGEKRVPELENDALFKEQFEHILRKLFFQETGIQLRLLDAGRSGAGVVLVNPLYDRARGAPVVVKYGLKDAIDTEHKTYQRYVEPFLVMNTTHLIGIPESSQNLAGMKLIVCRSCKA